MIHAFYADTEVFVTGGSGAVGKALIEKLLRSCNVRKVYVLLRTKKNFTIEQRMEKLKKAKVFKVLRATKPHMLDRLVPIPGDAALPNLAISPEHTALMENVSIVFHCAATVRFDEPLRVALKLNVGGTLEALLFAEKLKNLKIFMHVSTFYSNPYLKRVEPKIYESPLDWKMCLEMLKDNSEREYLDILTRKLIIGFPNTYTFTKNLAESVVNDFRNRIPVAIYRPSIVLQALTDPIPGFPPTMMGAIGLFVLVGAGILKTVFMSYTLRFDITPQDVGIKTMMYYAYRAANEYSERKAIKDAPVYMSSSSQHSFHTFYQMCHVMENGLWYKAAFEKNFMLPGCHYTDNRFVYKFIVFTKQILPAMLADGLIKLSGRKPILMGIVRKAYISLEVMKPFLFNTYDSPGMSHEDDLIAATEGTEFDLIQDVSRAKTDEGLIDICTTMIFSIREYLLNEEPKTIPIAQKRLRIKRLVYNILRAIVAYYILRWFYGLLVSYIY
ncbi:PREDICTED: fatty acyl-CoA reductase 1-like [Rhagoletis zephyria]|uniref:fatty acyl-CoA reductase 1-like n=1 Tax=Rhagoletis zephyria TaxID=28612 RepID=UPI00081131ED|nr:PREDICTED: fatty acyl-CoA reductase 1-like [Rhagoletis zephyria]